MKVYVVTSLLNSQDEGAEVNVIGIKKTKQEAKNLMLEALEGAKEMYEENNIDYDIEEIGDTTIYIKTIYNYEEDSYDSYDRGESIEYSIFESEVE